MPRRARLSDQVRVPLASPDPVRAFRDAHADRALVALPTSGTSGAPRTVVRTTDSWVCSFAEVAARTGLDDRSRVWVPGPLSSTMNLFAVVHASFAGASTAPGPGTATHAHLTPAMLARALDREAPLAGVHVVVAGDRLDPALSDRATFAGARVSHYYGAAELSFVAWGSHADNLQPLPEVEIEVRDGRLWVRSPYLCLRCDGPPGPFRRGSDGFATVGDRGRAEDGFLRVRGRGTDAVTTAGATVHVADVEDVLRPAATGALVVVGVPHAELGAVVAAVLNDPSSLRQVRAAAREALPESHRPRLWFHVAELPVTAAGKVDRAALAALLVSPGGHARRLG
ncbi:MAG TPA: AMP-binding protein [Nocardioidaceae bacterium]|nr:AMP-binding protein [Nocardioidaceae bacterium]